MPDRSPCRPLASIQNNKVSPRTCRPLRDIFECGGAFLRNGGALARGVTDARPATTRIHHASRWRNRAPGCVSHRECASAGLSRQAGTDHHPLSTRRLAGCAAAHRRRPAVADVGTPDRRAQSSRCRRRRRSPHRCASRTRRLHSLHARLIGLRDAVGLQANLPLDVPRDFVPVGFVALQPFLLSVVSSLGAKTLPEFIALAKEKPGELSYAATGRGTLSHLTGEALQQRAGIKLLMVPYLGGTTQALNDVISGRVPMVIDAYPPLAGRCRLEPSGRSPSARPNGCPIFRTCLPSRRHFRASVPAAGSLWSPRSARPTRLCAS